MTTESKPSVTHLTYAQAAKNITMRGIPACERTVRKWCRNGTLPVLSLGHRTKRVPIAAIDRMIKENTK